MENKKLRFKNGRFRILQLADAQDKKRTSPDTEEFIKRVIERYNPDFVVFTGDQIKSYGSDIVLSRDKKTAVRTGIEGVMRPVAESGVPFTAAFGNHDETAGAGKDFQFEIYKSYQNFIGNNYTADFIPVFSEKSDDEKFGVYLFDTFSKQKNGNYLPVTDKQVEFYLNKSKALEKKYGKKINSIAFQHIPPAEIYVCLEKTDKKDKSGVEGASIFSGRYYKLPFENVRKGEFMGENAASPDLRSKQIEAFADRGDCIALFFGHDHNNSFCVNYNGVDLVYTQSCGMHTYGPGFDRGARLIDVYEKDTSKYETRTVTYFDVGLGSYSSLKQPLTAFLYTESPSSVSEFKKRLKKFLGTAALSAISVIALKQIIK